MPSADGRFEKHASLEACGDFWFMWILSRMGRIFGRTDAPRHGNHSEYAFAKSLRLTFPLRSCHSESCPLFVKHQCLTQSSQKYLHPCSKFFVIVTLVFVSLSAYMYCSNFCIALTFVFVFVASGQVRFLIINIWRSGPCSNWSIWSVIAHTVRLINSGQLS